MAESKPLISSLPSGPGSVSKGARVSHFHYDAVTRTGELCSVLSASVRVTQAKKEKEKKRGLPDMLCKEPRPHSSAVLPSHPWPHHISPLRDRQPSFHHLWIDFQPVSLGPAS